MKCGIIDWSMDCECGILFQRRQRRSLRISADRRDLPPRTDLCEKCDQNFSKRLDAAEERCPIHGIVVADFTADQEVFVERIGRGDGVTIVVDAPSADHFVDAETEDRREFVGEGVLQEGKALDACCATRSS